MLFRVSRACLDGVVKLPADFAQRLLDEEQTVVTDGAGFGCGGLLSYVLCHVDGPVEGRC